MELILDNIRSAHNVGSLFRLADAMGVLCIHCCGITLSPGKGKYLENKKLEKTALGAHLTIPTITWESASEAAKDCADRGKNIFNLEIHSNAIPFYTAPMFDWNSLAIIVGHEKTGISERVLTTYPTLYIPMYGKNKSMNVSVAAGIVLSYFRYKSL